MFTIKTLNKISQRGLSRLPEADYKIDDACGAPDAIIVRSANMLEAELPESLYAVARAGAGTNNVPCDRCAESGVVVFNTPGANANAVKELVIGALILASRNVAGGIAWASTLKDEGDEVGKLVEKGKSQFVGPEIMGKTLGVVGLGAIGYKVANAAVCLGMDVLGYDPFLTDEAKKNISPEVKITADLDEIFKNSDYITLHLPVNSETRGFIGTETLAKCKPGVRIINFARGELVDVPAMVAALESGQAAAYVTDFPSAALIGVSGVICIPHLGASTPESEENCAEMAADQIKDYLENGNIVNSVNMPRLVLARSGGPRVCVVSKAGAADAAGAAVKGAGKVQASDCKTRGDYAYAVYDIAGDAAGIAEAVAAVDGVLKVRVI